MEIAHDRGSSYGIGGWEMVFQFGMKDRLCRSIKRASGAAKKRARGTGDCPRGCFANHSARGRSHVAAPAGKPGIRQTGKGARFQFRQRQCVNERGRPESSGASQTGASRGKRQVNQAKLMTVYFDTSVLLAAVLAEHESGDHPSQFRFSG